MVFSLEDTVLFYAVLPHTLQLGVADVKPAGKPAAPKAVEVKEEKKEEVKPAPVEEKKEEKKEEELDLFGDDDEDDEAYEAELERRKQEAIAAKGGKKKEAVIAKSSLLIDVKPWDDETDMAKLEEAVRSIEMEGLLWGASKLVPVGYGIKKLQINAVVVDDLVSVDEVEERVVAFEDYVQSMDVAAFNKI